MSCDGRITGTPSQRTTTCRRGDRPKRRIGKQVPFWFHQNDGRILPATWPGGVRRRDFGQLTARRSANSAETHSQLSLSRISERSKSIQSILNHQRHFRNPSRSALEPGDVESCNSERWSLRTASNHISRPAPAALGRAQASRRQRSRAGSVRVAAGGAWIMHEHDSPHVCRTQRMAASRGSSPPDAFEKLRQ